MKKQIFTLLAFFLVILACQPIDKKNSESQIGFVHTVFFWLNDSVTPEQKLEFETGLIELGTATSIADYAYGKPAGTDRSVVDNTYDYAWIVYFKDPAAHDLYQEDSLHLDFIEKYNHLWKEVKVYDTLLEAED